MNFRPARLALVGFGEVNSPTDLILEKCRRAKEELLRCGIEVVVEALVRDDQRRVSEAAARQALAGKEIDLIVACVAGWIPSHSVVDVLFPFKHLPVALWGLTGSYEGGRLVTTADQAGTSALRDAMDGLGFRFRYFYDTPDAPYAGAARVCEYATACRAAALLNGAKIGMMGYRDMSLYATLVDGVSLRRVIGCDIEVFETLEMVQAMRDMNEEEINQVSDGLIRDWNCDKPLSRQALDSSVRLYLAVMAKVKERNYQGVSLIDVDGVKKLLGFPPAVTLMLLADRGGVASIPENDGLGAVTQLMVRFLTGQVGAYFEFYEFMTDRVLVGVPDYVPSEVVDGSVQVRLTKFGQLSEGVLNVSKVKTGRVTLCRLAS